MVGHSSNGASSPIARRGSPIADLFPCDALPSRPRLFLAHSYARRDGSSGLLRSTADVAQIFISKSAELAVRVTSAELLAQICDLFFDIRRLSDLDIFVD